MGGLYDPTSMRMSLTGSFVNGSLAHSPELMDFFFESVRVMSDAAGRDGAGGYPAEGGNEPIEPGESLIAREPFYVSRVDLLGDNRDLERAEDVVVDDVRNVAAGRVRVHFGELAAGDVFHKDARVEGHVEHFFAGVFAHPISERRTEVH